jgi:transglutaminase-like putative cysteine protease
MASRLFRKFAPEVMITFSLALVEAYLGGHWHAFDPRNNVPRIGRILLARGRDAADVAMTTTFGPNTLQGFRVWTDEIAE